MKIIRNIARFAFLTFTTGITIFFFFILLCRTDLVFDLFNSKPVLLMLGLIVGAISGLMVGFITTYIHYEKVIAERNNEVKRLQKELGKAERIVKELIPAIRQAKQHQANTSAKEAQEKSNARATDFFSQISDLSDEASVVEEAAPNDEEETETQDDMSSDEA